jgi:DNA-binding SARP family transcriptional activator/tetratricopeptide (TPR) repeat protein
VQVRLLGPVDVTADGAVRAIHGARRKALLAVLALHPGEVVSAERIADVIWAAAPPATVVNTVQSHVSHLRRVLGSRTAIRGRPPGYLLDIGDDATDLVVAERLIREGSQATDPADGARLLQVAVDMWRGPPLADVAESAWFDEQVRRLDALLLRASEALIDKRLALGWAAQLIPDLERLSREHALHERIHGQLMVALYRVGRQADALAVYQRLRRTLDEELGISPGEDLRELELAILRQDARLAAPATIAVRKQSAASAVGAVPAQLPLAVRGFAGRGAELEELNELLAEADDRALNGEPGEAVLCAISGAPGTGKTSLAVRWAHQVADRYRDGQLYVNLRGFDPTGATMDPADALHAFLVAYRIPAREIPLDLPAKAALFRSVVAGKRVLLVLDNARDADHVRHLLPGAPGCLIVVTSRNQLTPLLASEGAHSLVLGPLTPQDSRELLVRRLGRGLAGTPAALDAIIGHCAQLPLALAIVAGRAAARPGVPLDVLAAEVGDSPRRLDALTGGDAATDLRMVFDWSYTALSRPAARLFRLLGLHPGADITLLQAACLAGLPPDETSRLVTELSAANLLLEHRAGRWILHDLLKAFAAERALAHESETDHPAALHRVLDYYLHTSHAAVLLLDPAREPVPLAAPQPGVVVEQQTTHDEALAWFAAEQQNLIAAIAVAEELCLDDHTWQLAWSLTTYLDWVGNSPDLVATQELALYALRRLGNTRGLAHAHREIGRTYAQIGSYEKADLHLEEARTLYTDLQDAAGLARAHHSIGWLLQAQGRFREALLHTEEALHLFRAVGDRVWEARELNANGWVHAELGEYRQTLSNCERAIVVLQELGDRHGLAGTWDTIGYAHHHLGDLTRAIACYDTSVRLFRQLGDRTTEANVLLHLGDSQYADGHADLAQQTWQRALRIFQELGLPVKKAQSRLDRASAPSF